MTWRTLILGAPKEIVGLAERKRRTFKKENSVQSSTISYSDMVIPEGITKHDNHNRHQTKRSRYIIGTLFGVMLVMIKFQVFYLFFFGWEGYA